MTAPVPGVVGPVPARMSGAVWELRVVAACVLLACQAANTAHAADDGSTAVTSAEASLQGDQPALLDAAIARYQALAQQGGWLPLNPDARLVPGVRDPEVRLLRNRLRLTGDYTGEMIADPLLFDVSLQEAVQRFQRRHGLRENGRVTGQTRVALNQPLESVLAELRYARDAWAALPPVATRRRVWVNIPEAMVAAIDGDRVALHMRAVVGHPTRPTPVLSSVITRVTVNPTWTVPQRIAGQDLLPRQLADSGYLQSHGFQVFTSFTTDGSEVSPEDIDWHRVDPARFPYRLRQRPGPQNSLGRYKFEFPNDQDIYLHDTPARALLGLSLRSLSSGCVRVGDPAALAGWLLGPSESLARAATDPAWQTRHFGVAGGVPVDLVYLNAWVSSDGRLHRRRDVYARAVSGSDAAAIGPSAATTVR